MVRIIRDLKTVLLDNHRKSLPRIAYELAKLGIHDREIPLHYFNCLLYKKDRTNIENYVCNGKMQRIIQEVFYEKGKDNPNFDNKLKFCEQLKENGIGTTKVLASNSKNRFSFNEREVNIDSLEDFIPVINHISKVQDVKTIFIKPIVGIGGANSFKVHVRELSKDQEANNIYKTIIEGDYIFQEVISQHEAINCIYSNSINTLRVHTYIDDDGEYKIASALMRFGKDGSVVDNGSSGGLYVPVNTKKWTLQGNGITYFRNGGNTYEHHPNSDFRFDGFEIPFSKEIEETVLRAAKVFPERVVGWDVAITDNGPIIIEGNHNPHIVMAQVACKGFKDHPHFKRLFAQYT